MVRDTYYDKTLVRDAYFGKTLGSCRGNQSWSHNLSKIKNRITNSKRKIGAGLFDEVTRTGHA